MATTDGKDDKDRREQTLLEFLDRSLKEEDPFYTQDEAIKSLNEQIRSMSNRISEKNAELFELNRSAGALGNKIGDNRENEDNINVLIRDIDRMKQVLKDNPEGASQEDLNTLNDKLKALLLKQTPEKEVQEWKDQREQTWSDMKKVQEDLRELDGQLDKLYNDLRNRARQLYDQKEASDKKAEMSQKEAALKNAEDEVQRKIDAQASSVTRQRSDSKPQAEEHFRDTKHSKEEEKKAIEAQKTTNTVTQPKTDVYPFSPEQIKELGDLRTELKNFIDPLKPSGFLTQFASAKKPTGDEIKIAKEMLKNIDAAILGNESIGSLSKKSSESLSKVKSLNIPGSKLNGYLEKLQEEILPLRDLPGPTKP